MYGHLPDLVDPVRLVEKGRNFRGVVKIAQMNRIRELVLSGDYDVKVELSFRKEEGINAVSGHVEAKLELECQRCLKPVVLPIFHDFRLGVISSIEESRLLPESFEPLLVSGKATRLSEVIEDELLLLLPMIPRHEQCDTGIINPSKDEKTSSFSVLIDLKKQMEKNDGRSKKS